MISREEAIERLKRMLDETQVVCNSYTATEPIRHALKKDEETYRMAIEALSQPERPKGRWDKPSLHGLNSKLNDLGVICSHCLKYADTDYDFCPNCGADMRKGEKE